MFDKAYEKVLLTYPWFDLSLCAKCAKAPHMTFGPSPWILLNCFPDRKEDHSKAEGTSTALRIPLRLLLVPLLDGADGVPGGLEHLQLRLPGEVPGHPRDHARLAEEDQG